jgi:hypothetical protein
MATPTGGPALNGKNMVEHIPDYRNRMCVNFTLDYPVGKTELWRMISRVDNLNECHPFCRSNKAISWDKNSRQDRLIYLNGMTYIRQFLTWKEGDGYDLIIGKEGGPQSYVVWEIKELGDDKSSLTITVYPYLLTNLSKIISYLPFRFYIQPKLKTYQKSVLNGFRYYNETGKPVPRNHWGRHSWFS